MSLNGTSAADVQRLQQLQQGVWSPLPLIRRRWLRVSLNLGVLAYVIAAWLSVDVNWDRVAQGMDRGVEFVASFMSPDFVSRSGEIFVGLQESLTMTFTATIIGVLLAVPVGLGAARNIAPAPVYYICRTIIALSRTFQEIIIAILFVAMFGFGPLAGVITLAFATIGFMAKLLAEDIEDAQREPLEAIRATGGTWLQWVNYAVQPQVMPRLIGLSLYRLDINFRESAVIGIVGAGGIGATLNTSINRYDYDTSAAILLLIIAIVLLSEYFSGYVRRWTQ
ncbi:phosphonate ABC transporter, permease protein PhnE [Pseudohongiella sp. O18]|uniref:phosphonate ABC transporter, permease protein PhnE n=1 Tax=Pseudohongiella sp. O18 TaxID=2904248 RepID=UPI000C5594E4|nr:phosphonate ABC transporter, permease protein PhnE [Pseudohongiella sp. O18]MAY55873.1 phosphonate ABC transporter, permease protein PhnE [Gammaproteobacteria bacterium]MBJ54582.1 phosphonate ABC transporter, permease protein PhnE [Gammaproteobacteria bacterium]HBN15766.1 phosphonate ABC transporter, permease protein PhnE [Pseudohongiella sp.]|tara:strand:+ start:146 stop:985 length:840 start_codon:yes stop_codon:yes gene_type:complete